MARLYADEQFPYRVVELLRAFGHDILTVQEAEQRGLEDDEVLAFAIRTDRAILTLNRRHFIRLHQQHPNHPGMVVCKDDADRERMAARLNQAISDFESLSGQLIRVNRPG